MSDDVVLAEMQRVLEAFSRSHPGDLSGVESIRVAFEVAEVAHRGQMRASGEPYIIHPVAVALTVAELGMGADTVAAALCHDVVEDTTVGLEEIRDQLGSSVAQQVDGVTKLDAVADASREQASASNLRKLLLAATADPRVLVLKIADRLHNVSTLGPLSPEKRARVARETMEVFAPLAHRLGMNEAAAQLEDASFAALEPELFAEISARMDAVANRREELLTATRDAAVAALADAKIRATVTGRQKHVYSTWRKTIVRKQAFDDIADLLGIRIIVTDTTSCYAALGVLHNAFPPVPGRFRDYIAQPRWGNYQSLHTTVAVDGVVTEVQIRSWAMHATAEHGVAAHWRYKEQPAAAGTDAPARTSEVGEGALVVSAPDLPWLHDLLESGEVTETSPAEFLDGVRRDLGTDEVVVFTPQGQPLALPEGATVLDAAYSVHTEIGHRCAEARVNGTSVPRGTVLRPGDQFEIVTGDAAKPTHAWLDQVVTGRARSAIGSVLHERERFETRLHATEQLRVALRHAGVGRGWMDLVPLTRVAPSLGYSTPESLLDAFTSRPELIAATAQKVRQLLAAHAGDADAGGGSGGLVSAPYPTRSPAAGLPVVASQDDLLVRAADCCSPAPGREAVGVPADGGVVEVHAVDCLALARTTGPLFDVSFAPTDSRHQVRLLVDALHRQRLLADIVSAAAQVGADVVEIHARTDHNHTTHVDLTAASPDEDVLWRLHARLRDIDGAYRVREGELDPEDVPAA